MPDPAFRLFEKNSTVTGGVEISIGNPVSFGAVEKGIISPTITVNLWNGKNDPGVGTAIAPRLYAVNGSGDASLIFNGTPFNGNKSMLEARSCGSFNTPADQDSEWTPIGPNNLFMLTMGDMPSNSMREIELRLNVPIDAPTLSVVSFSLQVSA